MVDEAPHGSLLVASLTCNAVNWSSSSVKLAGTRPDLGLHLGVVHDSYPGVSVMHVQACLTVAQPF